MLKFIWDKTSFWTNENLISETQFSGAEEVPHRGNGHVRLVDDRTTVCGAIDSLSRVPFIVVHNI